MPCFQEQTKNNDRLEAILFHALIGILLISTFIGCTGIQDRYVERHAIKNLTVVFLDEHSLHEQWKQIAGADAVHFQSQMNSNVPLVHTVRGFYDFASNTLYCPKWHFEVCGHELHHAALGQFHKE